MSDTPQGQAPNSFGAAARASDYIEEDTVRPETIGRRAAAEPPAERPIPPMPASPASAGVNSPAAPASPSEAPAASVEAVPAAEPVEPTGSVLFGGGYPVPVETAPQKATTGFRGVLASMGIPVKPSAAEAAEYAARAEAEARRERNRTTIRQATWTRAVSILVANPKGGTGKTPSSVLLGGTIASIRGGSTAIVEVADDPGTLNQRSEGDPRLGIGELVRDVDTITSAGQLLGYTAPQTSYASVICSPLHQQRERLTGEAVVAVSKLIDEYYGIRVMDSGNQPTSSAFRGAVSVSDVLVIPVLNAGDSVLEAVHLLSELRSEGGYPAELAARAIAVRLTDGRPEIEGAREEVEARLRAAGVQSLHEIPYDEHIAVRGQLSLSRLAPATQDAFAAAAADIVRTLQEVVDSASPIHNRKA